MINNSPRSSKRTFGTRTNTNHSMSMPSNSRLAKARVSTNMQHRMRLKTTSWLLQCQILCQAKMILTTTYTKIKNQEHMSWTMILTSTIFQIWTAKVKSTLKESRIYSSANAIPGNERKWCCKGKKEEMKEIEEIGSSNNRETRFEIIQTFTMKNKNSIKTELFNHLRNSHCWIIKMFNVRTSNSSMILNQIYKQDIFHTWIAFKHHSISFVKCVSLRIFSMTLKMMLPTWKAELLRKTTKSIWRYKAKNWIYSLPLSRI